MAGRLVPLVVGIAAATLTTACGDEGSAQTRGPVELGVDARLTAPDTIELSVMSCHGEPEVTRLSQGDVDVRIEVTATVANPGDACLDLLTVRLDAPLADRGIVDLTSGRTLRIQG